LAKKKEIILLEYVLLFIDRAGIMNIN